MKALPKILLGIITLISVIAPIISAQVPDTLWTRNIGTTNIEKARDVIENKWGYLAFGFKQYYPEDQSYDFYLVQTNQNGDTIWTRTYGDSGYQYGYALAGSFDGNYLLAGSCRPPGDIITHIYLIKVNAFGDTIWTKLLPAYNNDEPHDLIKLTDGGYMIAGLTYLSPDSSLQGLLIKIDDQGNEIWRRRYGDWGADQFWNVKQISDGGYIVTGWSQYSYRDVFLVRTTSTGDVVWQRNYGGPSSDEGLAVDETGDGGFLIAGRTYGQGCAGWSAYFLKTNSFGDSIWATVYDCSNYMGISDMAESPIGGYIATGRITEAGQIDAYMIKIMDDGAISWTLKVGRDNIDETSAIKKLTNGCYIIAGRTWGVDDDFYLIKLGPDVVSVFDSIGQTLPEAFALLPNFPNPFNASTTFGYRLDRDGPIKLRVYDINGKYISTLVDGNETAGTHFIVWDASSFPSGIYFARIQAGERSQSIKLILLK